MWKTEQTDANSIHVYPLCDLLEHTTTEWCICSPVKKEAANGFKIITHSAFDKREKYEGLQAN